jgi:hypothetical protein
MLTYIITANVRPWIDCGSKLKNVHHLLKKFSVKCEKQHGCQAEMFI